MPGRNLHGSWLRMKSAVLARWPRVTAADLGTLQGNREELMRVLKARYHTSYGEIEREVGEFEVREHRARNLARPALGIGPG